MTPRTATSRPKDTGRSKSRGAKSGGRAQSAGGGYSRRHKSKRRTAKKAAATKAPPRKPPGPERLQKVLAAAGVGSRRECEELILAGRVEVDRQVVREMGTKVDGHTQEIRLDGTPITSRRKVYYLVHKPPGVLSTNRDPSGRARVVDLLPDMPERLFTVGRLDMASEGLMLVTNDGELANQLTHPKYGVEKTYHVLVAGLPTREARRQLTRGVNLAEGVARVDRLRVKTRLKSSTLLEIVLSEGQNREIRRQLARIGHKVLKLKRVAIAGVRLRDIQPGEYRRLRADELKQLRSASRAENRETATTPLSTPGRTKQYGPDRQRSSSISARKRKKRPTGRKSETATRDTRGKKSPVKKRQTRRHKGKRT